MRRPCRTWQTNGVEKDNAKCRSQHLPFVEPRPSTSWKSIKLRCTRRIPSVHYEMPTDSDSAAMQLRRGDGVIRHFRHGLRFWALGRRHRFQVVHDYDMDRWSQSEWVAVWHDSTCPPRNATFDAISIIDQMPIICHLKCDSSGRIWKWICGNFVFVVMIFSIGMSSAYSILCLCINSSFAWTEEVGQEHVS